MDVPPHGDFNGLECGIHALDCCCVLLVDLQAVVEEPEGALLLWQQGVLPVLVAFCRELLHAPDQRGLLGAAALGYVGPETLSPHGASSLAAVSASASASAAEFAPQSEVMISTVGAYMNPSSSGSNDGSNGSSGSDVVIWSPRHQQWCLLLSLWVSVLRQLGRAVHVGGTAMDFLIAAEPRLHLAITLHSSSWHAAHNSSSKRAATADADHDSATSRALVLTMTGLTPDGLQPGAGRGAENAPLLLTLSNILEAERALQLLKFMVNSVGDWELQRPGSLAGFRSAAASLVEFVAAPSLER
jgi:hypothetical protein